MYIDCEPEHKFIKVSPEFKSKTLDIVIERGKSLLEKFFLIDLPGLYDTRGLTIEICNAICTSLVFQNCQSLIPVLIVDCHSLLSLRGALFLESLQTILNFLKLRSLEDAEECFKKF